MILGLGNNKEKFLYLDEFMPEVDWDKLHADMSFGISQSKWSKKLVSAGVHPEWAHLEVTPFLKYGIDTLSPIEKEYYSRCKTMDEKLLYITSLKDIPHPFWVLFIRNNKRIEQTGVFNKAVADDCYWTENAVHFEPLIELVNKMPFESIGRVILFMTEPRTPLVPHYDVSTQEQRAAKPNDDFIWFTTKKNTKSVYVMDDTTKEKFYSDPAKKFIWFNEMDYHGTDPVDHFSFSIRVDGKFKKEVKDKLLA